MRRTIGVVLSLVIGGLLVGLAGWLAGPAGVMLGILVVLTVGLRFAAYSGLFNLPAAARGFANWTVGVGSLCIGVIWLATLVANQIGPWSGIGLPTGMSVGTPGAQVLVVGSRDEVEQTISMFHWFLLEPDKDIIIRLPNGKQFVELPDLRLFKLEAGGMLGAEVPSVGDNISTVYIRARAGMARVKVSFVRK